MKAVANHHLMVGLNFNVLLRGASYRDLLLSNCLGLEEGFLGSHKPLWSSQFYFLKFPFLPLHHMGVSINLSPTLLPETITVNGQTLPSAALQNSR